MQPVGEDRAKLRYSAVNFRGGVSSASVLLGEMRPSRFPFCCADLSGLCPGHSFGLGPRLTLKAIPRPLLLRITCSSRSSHGTARPSIPFPNET